MITVNDVVEMLKTSKTLLDELEDTDQATNEERTRKYTAVLTLLKSSIMMLSAESDTAHFTIPPEWVSSDNRH